MTRHDRSARRARVQRGGTISGVATLLAATAHTVAGGPVPPLWLIVATTVLGLPVAMVMASAHRSVWRTGLLVAASQALLHVSFAVVGDANPAVVGAHHSATSTMMMTMDATGSGHSGAHVMTVAMVAAHAVAAAITFVLIAYGERLVEQVTAGLRQLFSRALGVPRGIRPVCVLARHSLTHVGASVALSAVSRRGPPALSLLRAPPYFTFSFSSGET